MNSPTSISPIDLERHRPPGQHLKGPIWIREGNTLSHLLIGAFDDGGEMVDRRDSS